MQHRPLTLHIRLTKACNAHCSYCSSWQESPDERLRPEALARIVRFVLDEAPSVLQVEPTHLTAQFVGGELSVIPFSELEQHVATMKAIAEERGVSLIFGAQSNLIVSERKAAQLYDLFEGRIGTSIDLTSNARTVKGDADRYRTIWRSADTYLRRNRSTPGAIYVLRGEDVQDAEKHLMAAAREARMLTFRPIFTGGIKSVQLNTAAQMKEAMVSLFDRWFMKLPIIVEPFFQLCESRLFEKAGLGKIVSTACAFQSDCTTKSINIEPNGDLYVCLEMADAGLAPIGNGLAAQWDREALALYASRPEHLHPECRTCPYMKSCHGGCMYESIAQGSGAHGRSFHCSAWKALFSRIDDAISAHGAEAIHGWMHRVATRYENARRNGIAVAQVGD